MANIKDCPGFETFGADVKAARSAKHLSRRTLAEIVNIDSRYLANIENEGTIPALPVIIQWNSQENRTPMSKTLSGKRVISEASPFDQWREIQFIGSVAPAAVVVGLDPVEYDLANLIPLHGGALEPVDQFLLQRCEKTLHARVVKAAMRAAHALPDGTEPGEHRPVLLAGVLAAVVGVQYQPLLITIA